MKRFFIFAFQICLSITFINAQKFAYPVSDIPDSLKKNAKTVLRNYTVQYDIIDINTSIEKIEKAITVLDRSGDKDASDYFIYDNKRQIKNIEVKVFNSSGSLTKTYGRKDIKDINVDSYGSLFDDVRALVVMGGSTEYPYTIVYKITYAYSTNIYTPNWCPYDSYNQSVQYSSFEVNTPVDYSISIKEINLPSRVIKSCETSENRKYSWTVKGLHAFEDESFSPSQWDSLPQIDIEPEYFTYEGYTGTMKSWKEYGKFYCTLNSGRDELSDETKEEVLEIVTQYDNDLDRAKALYKYMQNKTRYVSIQVGIGGIQPFYAKVVDEKGYGDCKALSNYMYAILKAAGIPSYYALINAGSGNYSLDTSFVHFQFNHAILYLPIDNKDYWLECTSQIMPFGFLGDFTDDRFALVITESGGVLKRTTGYNIEHNKTIRRADVLINADGSGQAHVNTTYSGMEYDDIFGLLHEDYEQQEDYLYEKHIDIPDFKINSFCYKDYPDIFPQATEKLDLNLINYASTSGTRLFIPLNLMNRFEYVPRKDSDRKNAIEIQHEYSNTDTIIFHLPEGYAIEHLPENSIVDYDFGKLEFSVDANGQEVQYIRHFELYRKTYPKEKYNDFVSFCREMKKADKTKLILVKL